MRSTFPVYIPTYKRYESNLTIKTFTAMGQPYKAVVDPDEVELYVNSGVPRENILVLPFSQKGKLVVPARNWIWDHAQASGTPYYWTFDDNIDGIFRLNNNLKIRVSTPAPLLAMEDFVQRYDNIALSGMEYVFFVKRKIQNPPYLWNRKIFSNMLIKTDIPYRFEGFYEEDTDLAIRLFKDGRCTCIFYAFLIGKRTTMTIKGGCTEHYVDGGDIKQRRNQAALSGRQAHAETLHAKHPDCAKVGFRFGHPQHIVNYERWKFNDPKLRKDIVIPQGVNEYGMELQTIGEKA